MREIKSRAWIKSKGIFYYDFAKVPYDVKMEGVLYRIFSGRMDKPQLLQSEFEENLFTGLQDINGKDIYEGDIYNYDNNFIVRKGEYEYQLNLHVGFYLEEIPTGQHFPFNGYKKFSYVGNIYENPELIEASK